MNSDQKERKAGLVRLRGGYSDRAGIYPRNKTIQLEEFDDDTRTKISNKLFEVLKIRFESESKELGRNCIIISDSANTFCKDLLNDVLCESNILRGCDRFDWNNIFERINIVIRQATYNEVLDIVEYVCRWVTFSFKGLDNMIFDMFNKLFEQEYVGYRFVNGRIVAISDKIEICAIERACSNPFDGCRAQIHKALDLLADRKVKDYKNSIKESISAVESICKVICKNEKATLGTALKQMKDKGLLIHPSLEQAFQKMYGYTSDQGGIRHAEGKSESEVTFEEAEYMLVSCSAFINYLTAKIGKIGY